MAVFGIPYLVFRGDRYYFRRAVPEPLVPYFGRREIKISLGMVGPVKARRHCRELASRFETIVELVTSMPELSPDTVDLLVRDYFAIGLDTVKEIIEIGADDPMMDFSQEASLTESELQSLRQQAVSRKYSRIVQSSAQTLLTTNGFDIPPRASEIWDQVCHGVLRAEMERRRIFVAMAEGRYEDIEPKDPLFQTSNVYSSSKATDGLSRGKSVEELSKLYVESKTTGDRWENKTRLDHVRVLSWFKELVTPERPIDLVTTENVRDFRDMLLKLPPNFSKKKEYEGMSLHELVESSSGGDKLAPKTVKKYFSMLKSFLNWCDENEYLIGDVPGGKIKVEAKIDEKGARLPYSCNQLTTLFHSPQYTGHLSNRSRSEAGELVTKDGMYWIPLISLYTGMRLGEIVQLLISDIKEYKEVTYFSIDKDEATDDDQTSSDKQLKTENAERCIPVHPELVRLGFLTFVAEEKKRFKGKGRLFREIKKGEDGYYSHNFSKRYSRYAKKIGILTKKHKFHSFRHNFKDALKMAGVPDSDQNSLMGHSNQHIGAKVY